MENVERQKIIIKKRKNINLKQIFPDKIILFNFTNLQDEKTLPYCNRYF